MNVETFRRACLTILEDKNNHLSSLALSFQSTLIQFKSTKESIKVYHCHNLMFMSVFIEYDFARNNFFGVPSSSYMIRLIIKIDYGVGLRWEQWVYIFHSNTSL